MSNISNIHTQFIARIEALLTSHIMLPHAYRLERNTRDQLRLGYAIAYRDATNAQLTIQCGHSVTRNISIIITRRFAANDLDPVNKYVTEMALFEDQQLILNDFEKYPFLGLNPGENDYAFNCQYVSDSGIQFTYLDEADGGNYLYLESIFSVTYADPIT